jgi:hypothetical protein
MQVCICTWIPHRPRKPCIVHGLLYGSPAS